MGDDAINERNFPFIFKWEECACLGHEKTRGSGFWICCVSDGDFNWRRRRCLQLTCLWTVCGRVQGRTVPEGSCQMLVASPNFELCCKLTGHTRFGRIGLTKECEIAVNTLFTDKAKRLKKKKREILFLSPVLELLPLSRNHVHQREC